MKLTALPFPLIATAFAFATSAMADDAPKAGPGGPLEATARRGVTARDPSTIVREGNTFSRQGQVTDNIVTLPRETAISILAQPSEFTLSLGSGPDI